MAKLVARVGNVVTPGTANFGQGAADGTMGTFSSTTPVSISTTTQKKTTPYDDFIKKAKAAGLSGSFDQNDLDFAKKYPDYGMSLINLMGNLNKAKTTEQRLLATEAINQLRKNYGSYWTGDKGNRSYAASYGSAINDALKQIGDYGPFAYSGADKYQDLLDRVTNFQYDPATDPNFASYRKQYAREGDRAAANALATAAAATGGVPSSYAATAAGQQANLYAEKLMDKVPELRAQAMTELLQGLGAMDTQWGQEYDVYKNRYDQMNQNLRNLQGQDEIDYKRYLDMLNAEYQRDRDAVTDAQQEWNNAWAIYQKTGKITGPLKNVIKETKTTASGGGGGGGSSGGGGGGYGGGGSTPSNTKVPTGSKTNGTGSNKVNLTGTSVSPINNTKAAPAPAAGGGGVKVNMTK